MEKVAVNKLRKFQSKAEIRILLDEYQKSETSITDFCSSHSISKETFRNWRHKYGEGLKSESIGFTELYVTDAMPASLFAEVGCVKIYQPVSAAYLKELAL